jgi:Ca-activated chloride channel family protein
MNQSNYATLIARDGAPVMLQSVKASGDLKGLLFEASIEQRFCNPTDKNMEVVYTFPLPWGAVLLGVDVQLGELHLTGAVVEKKLAEARYEEALSEGNAAIMLELNHDLSYSLNLGNLAAKENCVITLRYAQTLQFEQRGLRLMIPTVIAPRFGDAVIDGGLQPHQAPVHSLTVEYPFNIELRLHGDLALAQVASPSHPVGIAHTSKEGASILTVSLGRSASLDRDFVLVIDQLTHDSVAVVACDMVDPAGIVTMASFCPHIAAQEATFTAVKILVDCSGSMGGDSIEAAKRSLQTIICQFEKGDRFSLSRFGSTVEHRSRGLWSVTETTRLAAQRWVGGLDADLGGTEMESALASTFALAQTVASDVLLVTDGETSAIDQTIEVAQASGHRVFVVAIGSSPAEAHLRRLAEATGGACDFVAPGEAVEPAILRMFARLRSPRLNDVTVAWPEGFHPEWVTSIPKSVFDGDTVNLFAMAKQIPIGTVRLMGRVANDAELVEIGCALLGTDVQQSDTLSRMAVAERLQRINSVLLVGTKAFTSDLAVAYQLITDQTNFLLVHERANADKPTDMPELHKVSQMLAAGWGGVGGTRVHETPAHYGLASAPSIMFSRALVDSSDNFEIPAFSRKQASTPAVWRTANREPVGEEEGMTPMKLCSWLRATPEINWPTTYLGLLELGLDRWVVEWLEIVVAEKHASSATEQTIVRSFLHAMARRETFDMLSHSQDAALNVKGFAQKLTGLFAVVHGESGAGVDVQLADEIAQALQNMTATSWPDQVFELDAA